MEDSSESASSSKRPRDDSDESQPESPVGKRLRDNLLGILEDEDTGDDRYPEIHDLATFMKNFEEEIGLSHNPASPPTVAPESARASDSGESQPELGFLLEASDDELGLPPTTSGIDKENEGVDILHGTSEAVGIGHDIWGFDDEIPCYGSLGFDNRYEDKNEEEAVVFGGLFDYSDVASGLLDLSEFSWRPESLPAL